jgi:hypothetical protein
LKPDGGLVKIPIEITNWLTQHIKQFADDGHEPEYLRVLSARYHVLPIFVDWTGFWGLRADGEIFLVDTEYGNEPVIELDDRVRRIALFQGAKKYIQLQPLLPSRPPNAQDCPHCLGKGLIEMPDIPPDRIVCYCGGFGWLV